MLKKTLDLQKEIYGDKEGDERKKERDKQYLIQQKEYGIVGAALSDVRNAKADYLFNLFKGNDLEFLKKVYKDAKEKKKYPEGPVLNEYLFLVVINHRLHIVYESKAKALTSGVDTELLGTIKGNEQRILELTKSLEAIADRTHKIADVVDLHKATMDKAEEFIRKKIGTFAISCSKCGTVLQMNGIEHWALWKNDYQGHKFYFVFSEEAAHLVNLGRIKIEDMAFILRTSVEGLLWTAKIRKEKFREFNIKEAEANLKQMMADYESKMLMENKEALKEYKKAVGGGE